MVVLKNRNLSKLELNPDDTRDLAFLKLVRTSYLNDIQEEVMRALFDSTGLTDHQIAESTGHELSVMKEKTYT